MPERNKTKIKQGESWIKIANELGVSLDDLLKENNIDPTSRSPLPVLYPGQEIYIPTKQYPLYPSFIQAEAPQDYVDFGSKGQQLIDNYTLALKQGAMTFDQVPDVYKTAVYQRNITMGTNEAAATIANIGFNAAAFMLDPVGYTLSAAAQKGIAYASDRISGRNDYDASDLLGYTPIMGRRYAAENPGKAALVDFGAGLAGGTVLRNLPNWARWAMQNGRNAIQNAVSTTGLPRQTIQYPVIGKQKFGTVFQDGISTVDKTGTVYAGNAGGYRPIVSNKGFFHNQSSSAPTIIWNTSNSSIPYAPVTPVPMIPVTGPVPIIPPTNPPVKVPPKQEIHIYEQQPFNRWQMPNPTGIVGPHQPGTGMFTITGKAPVGQTIYDQALTNESLDMYPVYMPRVSVYQPGSISGTPSHWKSGLGITWTSNSPGNLIP